MITPLEVLEQLDVNIKSVGEREITASCPFHADRRPSFSMNAKTGAWICYSCGEAGGLSMLVEKVGGTGTNATELVREVRRQASRKARTPAGRPATPKPKVEPETELRIRARFESLREPPDWALEERYLTRAAARRYHIKWSKGWVIPIWSPDARRLWGWQYKRLSTVRNHPNGIKKSTTLFGLREIGCPKAVLVESPLDVVRLASVGVSAVATFGAYVSKAQVSLLVDTFDLIVLALDNDEAGIEQTNRILRPLARQVGVRRVDLPDGAKDPGDLDDRQVLRIFGDVRRKAVALPRDGSTKDDRQLVLSARP